MTELSLSQAQIIDPLLNFAAGQNDFFRADQTERSFGQLGKISSRVALAALSFGVITADTFGSLEVAFADYPCPEIGSDYIHYEITGYDKFNNPIFDAGTPMCYGDKPVATTPSTVVTIPPTVATQPPVVVTVKPTTPPPKATQPPVVVTQPPVTTIESTTTSSSTTTTSITTTTEVLGSTTTTSIPGTTLVVEDSTPVDTVADNSTPVPVENSSSKGDKNSGLPNSAKILFALGTATVAIGLGVAIVKKRHNKNSKPLAA
jgi:hypothetical protein